MATTQQFRKTLEINTFSRSLRKQLLYQLTLIIHRYVHGEWLYSIIILADQCKCVQSLQSSLEIVNVIESHRKEQENVVNIDNIASIRKTLSSKRIAKEYDALNAALCVEGKPIIIPVSRFICWSDAYWYGGTHLLIIHLINYTY